MVYATKFLLRWLYLNNLIYDRAEIQSLPMLHPSQVELDRDPQHHQHQHQHQHSQNQIPYDHQHLKFPEQGQQQEQLHHHQQGYSYNLGQQHPQQQQRQQQRQRQHHGRNQNRLIKDDIEWKRKALCKIALYPPGTSRLLALDSLRMEIVHQLAKKLHDADDIIESFIICNDDADNDDDLKSINNRKNDIKEEDDGRGGKTINSIHTYSDHEKDNDVINLDLKQEEDEEEELSGDDVSQGEERGKNIHNNNANSDNNLSMSPSLSSMNTHSDIKPKNTSYLNPKLREALELQRETRDYLPQLVSAVLHSPPSLVTTPNHHLQQQQQQQHYDNMNIGIDPISALRALLINRCINDPNFGIELCWLLEAEVGRTWKKLFEHRQETGKRLILVLPADKAAVIAKIGVEKRNAFDLLQDVECATAYGVDGYGYHQTRQNQHQYQQQGDMMYQDYHNNMYNNHGAYHPTDTPSSSTTTAANNNMLGNTLPLPESLRMKRCSHFGDTMHFIDRLTQISLKLRHIPTNQRSYHLQESLEELNRRLRRRMVTEGNVSLDVEDNLSPYDWPGLNDISLESLKYSVHLPLEPTATTWPSGCSRKTSEEEGGKCFMKDSSPLLALKTEHGVMKILNIVSSKCRLLASRERCPFLVHCEVVETGYEGSDARLYAHGGDDDVGTTVQEALGVSAAAAAAALDDHGYNQNKGQVESCFPQYRIPSELLPSKSMEYMHDASDGCNQPLPEQNILPKQNDSTSSPTADDTTMMLRGGNQEGGYPYSNIDNSGFSSMSSSPYDVVKEEQLQQLHEHFQSNQHHPHYAPQESNYYPHAFQEGPQPTTHSNLLDQVFGSPWTETCKEIRKTSPYGKVKGWRLASFIMKAGEDIRREALVMQVISKMKQWFEQDIPEQNRPYLKPYTILCVGGDAGLLECIRDAKSIDEVKKRVDGFTTLRDYFERAYGPPLNRGRDIHQSSAVYHQQQFQQQGNRANQGPMMYQQPTHFQQQQMSPNHHPNLYQTMHNMQHHLHEAHNQPLHHQPLHHQQQQHEQILNQQIPKSNNIQSNYPHHKSNNINSHKQITFEKAQDNFLRSLVGYSLICYILQIKDRHNANILLDREGHIMHIDFGFVLGDTPKMGKVPLFSERAPFKLTAEFWDVIGGWNFNHGGLGVKFCKMFEEAFHCAAMHVEELGTLIESAILNLTQNPNVARIVANGVRNRLRMRGGRDSVEQKMFIMDLVNTALTSWGTSTYDWLQKSMNGYI